MGRSGPTYSKDAPVEEALLEAILLSAGRPAKRQLGESTRKLPNQRGGWVERTGSGGTGGSFWYDLAPNIFAASVADLYPESEALASHTLRAVSSWVGAAEEMNFNFTHTAYNFDTRKPVDNGKWLEADASAGVAWLAYMGHRMTKSEAGDGGNATMLDCSRRSIAALESMPWNPLYEMLLPYGALAAARLNAEEGGAYDVAKLVNWCFDASAHVRVGWGALAGSFGGSGSDGGGGSDSSRERNAADDDARQQRRSVDGIIGSTTDGGGYAFFGNTAWFVSALSPLPRYDHRFADALGKWLMSVSINAQYFFPDRLDPARQSGPGPRWPPGNAGSAIAYEGLRKCDFSHATSTCLSGTCTCTCLASVSRSSCPCTRALSLLCSLSRSFVGKDTVWLS